MQKKTSLYGSIYNGSPDDLFRKTIDLIAQTDQHAQDKGDATTTIGLTGGSTPKALYQWIVDHNALPEYLLRRLVWSVSDERPVPLEDEESNFGNADRLLLKPLKIAATAKLPWPTEQGPQMAAAQFNQIWNQRFGDQKCFHVCFLGMGDDAHTASLFPGSSLIDAGITDHFTATQTTQKGWRLTITEAGLERCGQIIITVMGKNKKDTLTSVFNEPYDPHNRPAQILKNYASKVIWLIDESCYPAQ